MMTFEQWKLSRDIDVQHLEPDMEAALQSQYALEQERQRPVLVVPADCQWPARGYWTPANVGQ